MLPLLALALAACTGGPNAELAGEPGLYAALKSYYDRHGLEDGGRCLAPEFGGVTSSEVLERAADRLVLRVGYLYSDGAAPFRGDCRGFGTRTFTVARNPDGLAVLEMTGTQHPRGVRIDRIDDSNVW
jgi:hypothetical protein